MTAVTATLRSLRHARRWALVTAAVSLGTLAVAPTADGGEVRETGVSGIHFRDFQTENNDLTVSQSGDVITFHDENHDIIIAGMAQVICSHPPGDQKTVTCNTSGFIRITGIFLGEGDDKLLLNTTADVAHGGPGADTMTGSESADFLYGGVNGSSPGDGNDVIDGRGGNDNLFGNLANDTLRGGEGDDNLDTFESLDGSAGNDAIEGGPGNDVGLGGERNGTVSDGADSFSGGPGSDSYEYLYRAGVTVSQDDAAGDGLPGEGDNIRSDVEVLKGGSGNDRLSGSGGDNTLQGQAGDDLLQGNAGDDTLDGGGGDPGSDTLEGGDGRDTLTGGPGDDSQVGEAGADTLSGGGGSDAADGGEDGDTVEGGPGLDDLSGGPGDDLVRGADAAGIGGDGADLIKGGEGNDGLSGEGGDDTLTGGDGADVLAGGVGSDRGTYEGALAPVSVTLDDRANDGRAGEGDNMASDVENVTGGDDENTVEGSDAENRLEGGRGEDYVDGAGAGDLLAAGASGDSIRSRDNVRDLVQCGEGPDFVIADRQDSVGGECERRDTGRSRPSIGRTIVAEPTTGSAQLSSRSTLGMQLPQVSRFVPLLDKVALPVKTVLDSSVRTVALRSVNRRRRTQTARVSGGTFQMSQSRRTGVVDLTLKGGDFSQCTRRSKEAGASQRRTIRRLRGRTRGRHRFRGRNSAGVTRGTRWVMEDRCDGTLTRVLEGSVLVRDFAKRRNVVVRSGRSYLARPRRR
jgi:Ca2+-binding RTX toxin-like protein